MNWQTFVKDYLTFNKKERLAVICLLLLAVATYLVPKLFGRNSAAVAIIEDTTLLQQLDTVQKEKETFQQDENPSISFYEPTVTAGFTKGELFPFDPNTLSAEGWQKLGLNNRTIKTILNYRSKGGRFYKKEDLQKIWGLPDGFYNHVADYITLAEKKGTQTNHFTTNTATPLKGKRNISVVQVNSADTSALIALPGIGSKLAARIINFRDKLGGFYHTEQIKETYGLPDSTFQMLKPYLQVDSESVRKINLNTATKDALKAHPYVKWTLANAIVEYRNQHGNFKNIEDLKKIMLIDEPTFNKIAPYFSL